MKIEIANVVIGERHRRAMGDLAGLAKSIGEIGMLQPIGITEDNQLIFGERRLRACLNLGWTEIEARVIDMPNILIGENAENEVRKDFTPSERVAIAMAIADELNERRGRPRSAEKVQEIAPIPRGEKTRAFAAKKAGFGNHETFRQARHVVEKAEPELVDAMDRGVVSISAARRAADKPPAAQREIASGKLTLAELERAMAREIRDRTAAEPPLVKAQVITDAVTGIANCGLSPQDFVRLAKGPTLDRFHRSALAAYTFLKAILEVGDDQKRAG